jgi:glycosyltransferase 2 family protein
VTGSGVEFGASGRPVPGPARPPRPEIVEPAQRSRIRRPYDLLRFVAWLAISGLLLVLGDVAIGTTSGLESDISTAVTTLPDLLLPALVWVSLILLLALPISVTADLVYRRRWRTLFDAAVAAVTGLVVLLGFNYWADTHLSGTLLDALTTYSATGARSPTSFPVVASLVAFVSVVGLAGRPRLLGLSWLTLGGFSLLLMVDGKATALALIFSVCIGHAIGIGLRWALGSVNPRPSGAEVAFALYRVSTPMASLQLVDEDTDVGRVYLGRTTSGALLDVYVLDRDRRAAGVVYQWWRRIRVQSAVERRASLSLRVAVDRAALPSYAAAAAGARTPRLCAAASVTPDAVCLAYQHVADLRRFSQLQPEEVTDELITDAWVQARRLHRAGIAHESLHSDHLAVDATGSVWLLGMAQGEIAADSLNLRIDDAELLVTTALLVGAERAVGAALNELTPQRLGYALPLLQPIALSRESRQRLRSHRELLGQLQESVVAAAPTASTEPLRLDRVRPRVILSFVAFAVAVSLLLQQVGNVDPVTLVTAARWQWFAIALLCSVITYLGATTVLLGFAPPGLSFLRTMLAQLASTFVTLVAPPAVGGVATNTRYLQKAGVKPALALSSVGVSQVFVFGSYLVLIFAFGLFTGRQAQADLIPGRTVLLALLALLVAALLAMAVPLSRRIILARLAPMVSTTLPRLLQMLRSPRRIALGVGGALLLNLAYAGALFAAVRAYGGDLAYPTVGFVYLAAGAIAAAAPTPGGIGAVEAALAAGLTTTGLPGSTAVSAALLFRAVTFWLPVLPGWASFAWLQRQDAL